MWHNDPGWLFDCRKGEAAPSTRHPQHVKLTPPGPSTMPNIVSADVVIAGGSYAGLSLALALSQELGAGGSIAVIDLGAGREAPVGNAIDPRASSISSSSRNLLIHLGLWDDLASSATPVRDIALTDSSLNAGIRPTLLTYDNTASDGSTGSWIVPNECLATALDRAVTANPAIEVRRPAQAVGLTAHAAHITVELADGCRINAALAIAADGRRSALRQAAGISIVSHNHNQTGIVTRIAHDRPHNNCAAQHFLPNGPFAMLPLVGGHHSCITWSEDTATAARILELGDDAFLDEVDRRVAGRLGVLTLDGPRRSWPLETHLARRYIAKRFALVGDAAHGVHPIAGQGLNLGFRDVAALVECIGDVAHVGLDLGDASGLERYERWRRFDAGVSSAAFGGLNGLFSNSGTWGRSAREFGLGVLNRAPALKQVFVDAGAGVSGDLPRLLRRSAGTPQPRP